MYYRFIILGVAILFLSCNVFARSMDKANVFELEDYAVAGGVAVNLQDLEEDIVRKVVFDSQHYESLTIYTNPSKFDKNLLTEYWVQPVKGGKAIQKVMASVQRLLNNRWHYGKDSRNEEFTFRRISIFPPGDFAEVQTYERWYLPMVDEEGRRVQNKNPIIEFPVTYTLRKIDGKWLIQDSTVIYANK